jgi:hypothetical protein
MLPNFAALNLADSAWLNQGVARPVAMRAGMPDFTFTRKEQQTAVGLGKMGLAGDLVPAVFQTMRQGQHTKRKLHERQLDLRAARKHAIRQTRQWDNDQFKNRMHAVNKALENLNDDYPRMQKNKTVYSPAGMMETQARYRNRRLQKIMRGPVPAPTDRSRSLAIRAAQEATSLRYDHKVIERLMAPTGGIAVGMFG